VSASPATFAHHCGVDSEQRNADLRQAIRSIETSGVELVRLTWCDTHGMLRGKTLTTAAAIKALDDGVGMVGTLLLKDTGDRTAYKVFEPGGTADLPAGFAGASNLMLLPDPTSFQVLPWATGTGWLRCQAWFQNGTPVPLDTRRVLQTALDKLRKEKEELWAIVNTDKYKSIHTIETDHKKSSQQVKALEDQLVLLGQKLIEETSVKDDLQGKVKEVEYEVKMLRERDTARERLV